MSARFCASASRSSSLVLLFCLGCILRSSRVSWLSRRPRPDSPLTPQPEECSRLPFPDLPSLPPAAVLLSHNSCAPPPSLLPQAHLRSGQWLERLTFPFSFAELIKRRNYAKLMNNFATFRTCGVTRSGCDVIQLGCGVS
jgi:hypothetical protein